METNSFQDLAQLLPRAFQADKAGGISAVVCVHITGANPQDWTLTIKDKQCALTEGTPLNPRVTLTADENVVMNIFSGKMNGVRAFMMGKLKVSGDMYLAQQLVDLFNMS